MRRYPFRYKSPSSSDFEHYELRRMLWVTACVKRYPSIRWLMAEHIFQYGTGVPGWWDRCPALVLQSPCEDAVERELFLFSYDVQHGPVKHRRRPLSLIDPLYAASDAPYYVAGPPLRDHLRRLALAGYDHVF